MGDTRTVRDRECRRTRSDRPSPFKAKAFTSMTIFSGVKRKKGSPSRPRSPEKCFAARVPSPSM
jgi:hypothetical protein